MSDTHWKCAHCGVWNYPHIRTCLCGKEQGFKPALARKTDPDTSQAAAKSVDATKMETVVYDAICTFGEKGCTVDELNIALPHLRRHSISPRIKPLIYKGLVCDTGRRRIGETGRGLAVVAASKFFMK